MLTRQGYRRTHARVCHRDHRMHILLAAAVGEVIELFRGHVRSSRTSSELSLDSVIVRVAVVGMAVCMRVCVQRRRVVCVHAVAAALMHVSELGGAGVMRGIRMMGMHVRLLPLLLLRVVSLVFGGCSG